MVKSQLKDKGQSKVLELDLDFEKGAKFPCPCCGEPSEVHDTLPRRWRHLQFWQHETYIHARVSRTKCEKDGVLQVPVPWAREGSGFTLLFEAFAMALSKQMPVSAVADLLGEHQGRIWRVIHHYVGKAHAKQDWSEVETLGVDETATRKGHKYATVVADIDSKGDRAAQPGDAGNGVSHAAKRGSHWLEYLLLGGWFRGFRAAVAEGDHPDKVECCYVRRPMLRKLTR